MRIHYGAGINLCIISYCKCLSLAGLVCANPFRQIQRHRPVSASGKHCIFGFFRAGSDFNGNTVICTGYRSSVLICHKVQSICQLVVDDILIIPISSCIRDGSCNCVCDNLTDLNRLGVCLFGNTGSLPFQINLCPCCLSYSDK